MRQKISSLRDLVKVDRGIIDALFRTEMKRIGADLDERPAVNSARKLTLVVACKPVAAANGALDSVDVEIEVTSSIPRQRTRAYSMVCTSEGELIYNDHSLDEVQQRTLDEEANRKESA